MKHKSVLRFFCMVLLLALASRVYAQEDGELILSMSRDFGYSSGTGRIQGTFSIKVSGPEDLRRVVFFIDGKSIAEDTEAPFSVRFRTGDYPLGEHSLSAAGYTASGLELRTPEYHRTFVSADEGMRTAGKLIIPILGIVLTIMLLSFVLPTLLGKGKKTYLAPGAPRNYGPIGGTVCPKCGRPFAMHFFKLNLVVGALDRCPYCGRWSLVRRFSVEALRAAEAAELETSPENALSGASEEDHLRKELEDSRFRDV